MIKKLIVDIDALTNKFVKKIKDSEDKLESFSNKAKNMGQSLSLTVTVPLAAMGIASIRAASDVQEAMNKVDVAFGNSATIVKNFAKATVDSFGIAEGTALDMAALFGDMGTSMGLTQEAAGQMSTELVGLAGDLASFKNIRLDVAETALKSIYTGETESLKQLGIVMTQANLEAFALGRGMNANIQALSEAEKVALRYAFVMDRTKNAHGDYARTADGAANLTRTFQERIKELSADIGRIMLPIYEKVVAAATKVVKWFSSLDDSTKRIIVVMAGLAAAAGPVLIAVSALTTALPALGVAFGVLTGPIGLTVTAIGLAAAAIWAYWDDIQLFIAKVDKKLAQFDLAIAVRLDRIGLGDDRIMKADLEQIKQAEETIKRINIKQGIGKMATNADGTVKTKQQLIGETTGAIKGIQMPTDFKDMLNAITAGATEAGDKVEKLFDGISLSIMTATNKAGAAYEAYKNNFTEMVGNIIDVEGVSGRFASRIDAIKANISKSVKSVAINLSEDMLLFKDFSKAAIEQSISFIGDVLVNGFASVFNKDIKFDFKQLLGSFLAAIGDMMMKLAIQLKAIAAIKDTAVAALNSLAPGAGVAAAAALFVAGAALKGGGMALSSNSSIASSGGGRSGSRAFGDFGQGANIKVQVSGQLVGDGTQLRAVLNNTQYGY